MSIGKERERDRADPFRFSWGQAPSFINIDLHDGLLKIHRLSRCATSSCNYGKISMEKSCSREMFFFFFFKKKLRKHKRRRRRKRSTVMDHTNQNALRYRHAHELTLIFRKGDSLSPLIKKEHWTIHRKASGGPNRQ